jgi:hypothetical protein
VTARLAAFEAKNLMSETEKSTGLKFEDVLFGMMSQPEEYSRLFMSVSSEQRQDFEDEIESFGAGLLDARAPSFQAVFPPDILVGGQHLVLVMISREPVQDPGQVYRSLASTYCRRMVFGLGSSQLVGFEKTLKQFMSSEERDAFDRHPNEHLMFEAKPGAFGAMILRGMRPEKEARESTGLHG